MGFAFPPARKLYEATCPTSGDALKAGLENKGEQKKARGHFHHKGKAADVTVSYSKIESGATGEEWAINSVFFEEQASREGGLVCVEMPDIPAPSEEGLATQLDFAEGVSRVSGQHQGCSPYVLLVRDEAGKFKATFFTAIPEEADGNWALVLVSCGVSHHDGNVPAEVVGARIAEGLDMCGLVPDTIDKVLCLSYLYDSRKARYARADEIPMPILYSDDEGYPGLVPCKCVEVCDDYHGDFTEHLHAWPGYARFTCQPTPAAQKRIDLRYAGYWKSRLKSVLNDVVCQVVVRGEPARKALWWTESELDVLVDVLFFGYPERPRVFARPFFEGLGSADETSWNSSDSRNNEFPMSADAARRMVEECTRDLGVVADIAGLWVKALSLFDIVFAELGEGEPIEPRLEKMDKVGRMLGVDEAVAAYFAGVPAAYL